jgi:hypothetical protein
MSMLVEKANTGNDFFASLMKQAPGGLTEKQIACITKASSPTRSYPSSNASKSPSPSKRRLLTEHETNLLMEKASSGNQFYASLLQQTKKGLTEKQIEKITNNRWTHDGNGGMVLYVDGMKLGHGIGDPASMINKPKMEKDALLLVRLIPENQMLDSMKNGLLTELPYMCWLQKRVKINSEGEIFEMVKSAANCQCGQPVRVSSVYESDYLEDEVNDETMPKPYIIYDISSFFQCFKEDRLCGVEDKLKELGFTPISK